MTRVAGLDQRHPNGAISAAISGPMELAAGDHTIGTVRWCVADRLADQPNHLWAVSL